MNKIEFKELDKEQMIIAFNQLKDDYHNVFEENTKLKEEKLTPEELVNMLNPELVKQNEELKSQIFEFKSIFKNIDEIIKRSITNVGFNDDCYEFCLSSEEIEEIYEMIP